MDVAALKAGRELDAIIAAKVMGIGPREVRIRGSTETVAVYSDNPAIADGNWDEAELHHYGSPPPYSTDITAAWQVLTKLQCQWEIGYDPGGWGMVKVFAWVGDEDEGSWEAHCATFSHPDQAPAAICKAALLALTPHHD